MRLKELGWVLNCLLFVTLGCRSSFIQWNGKWRLNPLKSSFQGPVFTITVSADGEYQWHDGTSSYAFRCDGKFRPIEKNGLQACVKTSPTMLRLLRRENGTDTKSYLWELSEGGRIFTSTASTNYPTRTVVTGQLIASRLSGSLGFAGLWRNTTYLQQHAILMLKLDDHVLHVDYPSAGQHIDAPLDGVDTPVQGSRVLDGSTCSVRHVGSREFDTVTRRYGKVTTEVIMKLGGDGETITESWRNSDQPNDKGILVYDKQ